jgi:hypothetical protein
MAPAWMPGLSDAPEAVVDWQFLAQPMTAIDQVGDAVAQLRSLPWAAHALAAGALAAGIILWLIGRRVLKPMVVVLCALLGAAIGFVAIPMTALAGSVSVYVGLVVGLAAGALLGALLYKFSMAIGLGLVLGVAAPLTVAAGMSFRAPNAGAAAPEQAARTPASEGEPDGDAESDSFPAQVTEEVIRRQIDNLRKQLEGDGTAPEGEHSATPAEAPTDDARALEDVMRSTGERVQAFAKAVAEDVATGWGQLAPRHRLMLTGSAGVGLAMGIILGIVLPGWSAGMVTALLGAGIWLCAGSWLAIAAGMPGVEHLHRPAREWLVVWLGVSALGMVVQWVGMAKKKPEGKGGGKGGRK